MMAKKWIGGDRLLALAEFLETDPRVKGHFDMDIVTYDTVTNKWPELDARGRMKVTCGTAACAMGWAPMVPVLKRAGLRYSGWDGYAVTVETETAVGFVDSAIDLFGISETDAGKLFYERSNHRTPKQVARNIRRFVAKRQRELSRTAIKGE